MTDKPLPKILISAVPAGSNPWLMASAVAEDGTVLYEKSCSDAHWTRVDLGLIGPESAHSYHAFKAYKAHYPDGFTLCDCIDGRICNPWLSEREALKRAIEMIGKLRGYTRDDADRNYGAEWDAELAALIDRLEDLLGPRLLVELERPGHVRPVAQVALSVFLGLVEATAARIEATTHGTDGALLGTDWADLTQDRMQCDYVYERTLGGYLCCGLALGHAHGHRDCFVGHQLPQKGWTRRRDL